MEIFLENPKNGKEKKLKSSWSWTCFFFYFTGIPLFNRGLPIHGVAMLIMWLAMLATSSTHTYTFVFANQQEWSLMLGDVIALIMIPPCFFYSIKANKMGIKALLNQGWQISEQTDTSAKIWAKKLA